MVGAWDLIAVRYNALFPAGPWAYINASTWPRCFDCFDIVRTYSRTKRCLSVRMARIYRHSRYSYFIQWEIGLCILESGSAVPKRWMLPVFSNVIKVDLLLGRNTRFDDYGADYLIGRTLQRLSTAPIAGSRWCQSDRRALEDSNFFLGNDWLNGFSLLA